jgi:general secretion pathway protein E
MGAAGEKERFHDKPVVLHGVSDGVKKQRRRSERRLRMEAFLRGEADVRAFASEMLAAAIEDGASDIHIEPGTPAGLVRFRVRGELREAAMVPQAHHKDLARRLKVMANLVVYQDTVPQDGRMTLTTEWGTVDVRVSVVPTGIGEKFVLRLAGDGELLDLASLGLTDADSQRLRDLLREPQGLVIATGPTGSGKTTTLYSSLRHLKATRPGASLASIEDPIEVELPFVAQTQVDRGRGLDFAGALRSVLRQDPDVLMVGEIRDGETARIAVQAGLTGHLVLSTLHAESAVGIFARLIDLGVEPFLAASSTLAGISQRLVPKLCLDCRRPSRPSPEQVAALQRAGIAAGELEFHDAEGCPACDYAGRVGRTAVFEILVLSPDLKRRIAAKVPTHELMAAARAAGLSTLLDAAVQAAARGDVALADALAVASQGS